MRQTRRRFLRTGFLASAGLAGCAGPTGDTDPTPTGSATDATDPTDATDTTEPSGTEEATPTGTPPVETVALETVAEGFTSPLAFADPPGDHQYVADQAGQVYLVGTRSEGPFLDVTDRMVSVSGYSERGLLGIAFHPEYPDEPRVYVRYSAPPREGTPSNFSHTFVLSEFQVRSDGLQVVPGSERTVLEIPEPQANHNAGAIAFGPDGYLYVTVGDGGGANDAGTGHVEDWYDGTAGGNGQDVTENLLGSLLRIDVDDTSGEKPYGIPEDNPLVGEDGLDEQYAWGLRNPWGLSFAGEELFVADVGQNRFEEINLIEKGGNYGWNVREGMACFQVESCPRKSPRDRRLQDPIVAYPHSGSIVSGVAVVGGYLYRGDAIPGLRDRYVFGDWRAAGELFVASRNGDGPWTTSVLEVEPAEKLPNLLGIGEDRSGELYLLTSEQAGVSGSSGAIHRVVPS